MGSLQDQLLKSGLVNEQQLREAKSKKHKQRKKQKKAERGSSQPSLAQAYAERARAEQRERDRELNRRREEARRRRELKARLRQIIHGASKNDKGADVPRHFDHGGKIRRAYLTKEQFRAVNSGALGLVYHAGRYHVVEASVVRKVEELDPAAVAFFAPIHADQSDTVPGYEDDKYKVPDDLVW